MFSVPFVRMEGSAIPSRPSSWLLRAALASVAVGAAAWVGSHQSAVWAIAAGAASLAAFGRDPRPPRPEPGPPELRAAFVGLCTELKLEGTLYAYYDDEQLLRPAVSMEPAAPLRIGDDPLSRVLHAAKPQVFNTYADPAALGAASFQGRSTLVYPLRRRNLPMGLAVFQSRSVAIGPPVLERLQDAEPLLALLLENEVLAGRLARSQGEKDAMMALTRLAQGQSQPEQVFQEAALHLRRLTGASHAAIAARMPGDRLVLAGLSADGGARAREAFMAVDWAEREWPHLRQALADPAGCALVSLGKAPLTPTEAAWARQVAPDGHLLSVAFGPRDDREGLLLLCWPEDGALRIHESRLAQRLGDLMGLVAAARRHSLSRQTSEAREAAVGQLAATQEALMGRLAQEVRSAAYAVGHWRDSLQAGDVPTVEVLEALDKQAAVLSSWLDMASGGPQDELVALSACMAEAQAIAREACRRKGQTLLVEAGAEALLPLSRQSLVQVLGVLLDNASRFSPPGTTVRMWTSLSEAWATIYVGDEGIGIPFEAQARIGEPGFQVEPGRGGLGMSLAHARQLVDQAGGLLGFAPHGGEGTTFYVTLPRRPVEGTDV